MRPAIGQFERYLQEALGIALTLKPWRGSERLAPFLRHRYSFWEMRLADFQCLAMFDAGPEEQSPAVIRKHITQVRAKWPGEVIYVPARVTAYNRSRLIQQRVPFVIPGNQIYLPMFGVVLREHFKQLRAKPACLSPATQVVLIEWLLGRAAGALTPAQTAKRLAYSPMTMTRALKELEAAGLGEIVRRGKERWLQFPGTRRDIWTRAQPMLRSPVTRRVCIPPPGPPAGICAGLEALAQYTMLAPPGHPVLAVFAQDKESLDYWHKRTPIPADEPDAVEVEAWSYDPRQFAERGAVDRLSLYLSLKDMKDERVEAALDEMIGSLKW